MKFLLTINFLFLFPLFSFGQINTSLDFIGGIDYTYRDMRVNNNPSFSDTLVVRIFDENETGKINFRFGFNFNKRVSKNIFFKTGLRFASVGYKGKENDELRWGNQQAGGVFNPNLPGGEPSGTVQLIYNYLFIEVPLVARYEFSQKKFTPFIELGVAPSLFLKSRLKLLINNDSQISDNDDASFSRVHFVGVVSFGGNYAINEGLQFFAQPTFRYHLTRLFKYGSIKEHLLSGGLEIGLRKRLN